MPGTTKKSYPDDNFDVGNAYVNRNHSHNFSYPQPDSPSAFSTLTTATRRDEEEYEEDPDAPVVIRVIAPKSLRQGYTMDVLYDGKPYTIEIPRGGVKEGQEFETIIDPKQPYQDYNTDRSYRGAQMERHVEEEDREDSRSGNYSREKQSRRSSNSRHSSNSGNSQRHHYKAKIYDNGSELTINEDHKMNKNAGDIKQNDTYPSEEDEENKEYNAADAKTEGSIYYDENGIPIGGWRTRMFSCCDVLTQSTFWMGFFAAPVLMAQLVTRLKLTWNGREGPPEETSLSFNRLILSLVFTMGLFWIPVMGSVCLLAYYLIVIVYVGSHVRAYMRRRYKIPSTLPTRFGERIDDVCMMFFCGCCSSIQMVRHTHDDKDYPGHACTTTGLEFDAPEVV